MKYPLNSSDFNHSLRFWIEQFLYSKLISLNNYKIKDKERFNNLLNELLSGGRNDIEKIHEICKSARLVGLIGINYYANPIYKFYKYCERLGFQKLEEINEYCLQQFVSVHTSSLKNASIRNYHFAINHFFSFISENNIENNLSYNFSFKMPNFARKIKQELPEFLNENEINSFLKSLQEYKIFKKPTKSELFNEVKIRNQLIILMILFSGARVSEILELKIKDVVIDVDYYILQLRGKGNKPRTAFIQKNNIHSYFEKWIEIRKNLDSNLLFISVKNTKNKLSLTQSYIYKIIEELLLNAGIRKAKNGPHLLRHSFATLLYKKSKDLILVQESLGHSSVETSRIYTHFDSDRLKYAANIMDGSIKK